MDKNEYLKKSNRLHDEINELQKKINDLHNELIELNENYVNENAAFPCGTIVSVTFEDGDRNNGAIGNWKIDNNGELIPNLFKLEDNGRLQYSSFKFSTDAKITDIQKIGDAPRCKDCKFSKKRGSKLKCERYDEIVEPNKLICYVGSIKNNYSQNSLEEISSEYEIEETNLNAEQLITLLEETRIDNFEFISKLQKQSLT